MNTTSYLNEIKKMAKLHKIKYDDIQLSTRPDKKVMLKYEGKTIHFGNKGSKDFIIHKSENNPDAYKLRDAYRSRHSKILLKDGTRAIDKKYSPAYLSYWLLW
jgi:hypothetical protein